ncbi:MAG: efflux RND transporter periplasmic adaptor subunit [Candidatus Symbiothrix sp.]|jgi:cobalt-zinc-cadmium efflux system membrane fusion protein|nr:efflux RND transporter periplasmic adaptor subunit [Candidatus Symbiothrix sp.]
MNKSIKSIVKVLFLILIVTFVSCKGSGKPEIAQEVDETPSEVIELTGEQMEAVGIELGVIELKNLHSIVRANGQLVLPPQNKADVNSLTSGIIRKIVVTEGIPVRKGQTVALLENLDIVKLQEEYLALKQELTYSSQEYERQKELNAQNAGTGKIFQQTQAQYEANRAKLKGLETQLRQLNMDVTAVSAGNFTTNIPILAPISGVIGKIVVKTGSYADMQTVLMEIADHSQMHCDLQVFEQDFPKIKQGQTVEISLTNQGNQILTGTVDYINQSFENDSKSIIVHVKINRPNAGAQDFAPLLPGMYVSALINVGSQTVKAVPSNAIANAEGKQYIFVASPTTPSNSPEGGEHLPPKGELRRAGAFFRKVEVVTGASELGYVEIRPLETLPEGATIITKGAFYVMSMAQGNEESDED